MFFNKKNKKSVENNPDAKPFLNEKEDQMSKMLIEARTKLASAEQKNNRVIDKEIKKIRRIRDGEVILGGEETAIRKIKSAYYGLGTIRATQQRLSDIESMQELFGAMKLTSESMNVINDLYKKAGKPNAGQFKNTQQELDKTMSKAEKRLSEMYGKVGNIDNLVTDDVVEELIQGKKVENYVNSEAGMRVSIDDVFNIDLNDMNDFFDEKNDSKADTIKEIRDLPNLDFSDF